MRSDKARHLLTYWSDLYSRHNSDDDAATRPIWPERSDVQPTMCSDILPDMFILDIDNAQCTYRLAGTGLCAVMHRELKGECLTNAYADADRRSVGNWIRLMTTEDYGVLICGTASSPIGETVSMESVIMPLNHMGRSGRRALGLTAAIDPPYWLGSIPLGPITVDTVRILRPWEKNGFRTDRPMLLPRRAHPALSDVSDLHIAQASGAVAHLAAPQAEPSRPRLTLIQGGLSS